MVPRVSRATGNVTRDSAAPHRHGRRRDDSILDGTPSKGPAQCPDRRRSAVRVRIALAVLALALAFVTLAAEARHPHDGGQDGAPSGQFDYYLLSLSWAPTYCLTHADDGAECTGKGYGFVLHGLWPQYDARGYPQNCPTQLELSKNAASIGRTLYPSVRLMQHEWLEHGTCSGLDAQSYFRAADRATVGVNIPTALETPRTDQYLDAEQIIGLFRHANPQMPEDAVTVACRRHDLSEVRVCLTKDLRPRSCGRGVRTTCPHVAIRVPASR